MTGKRFECYFDNIVKKWCVQDTDSLDMHYVADEQMGEEFAHLLNLYQQALDNVEKENEQLKKENQKLTEYGRELLEYINAPPKHRKSIFDAVVCFKNKKGDME